MPKAGKVILGVITAVGAFFGIKYLIEAAPEGPEVEPDIEVISITWE